MQKTLIVVGGPTAVGKTALGIRLANHFSTDIISADSRQFYRELAIGTAKPTAEELSQANHLFVNNLSLEDHYSVGEFEREVLIKLDELFKLHDTVIMVGGSGLFVRVIAEGLDEFPEIDKSIREELNEEMKEKGIVVLQERLKALDSETYHSMDIQNSQRLVRALEMCIGTGKPFSFFKNRPKPPRPFSVIQIGLNTEREVLYDRINTRVDLMITQGLVEEARQNLSFRNTYALRTVGYQELFEYFDDKISLEEAIELIKRNTRRFAKRQITWFKKEKGIAWFEPSDWSGILEFITSKK
jgi:tRNA dimethylallyltransferase